MGKERKGRKVEKKFEEGVQEYVKPFWGKPEKGDSLPFALWPQEVKGCPRKAPSLSLIRSRTHALLP